MESNAEHSHLTPAARRRIDALVDELEGRLISTAVTYHLNGVTSPQYQEARKLSGAARAALRDALDAVTWPAAYHAEAIDLDRL